MERLLLFTGTHFREIKIDVDNLDEFYKHLGCDCLDIARRRVGSTYYDIFCDDEGLFKENNPITAISSNGERMLVGNLIFSHSNSRGETVGLSDEDVENITSNVVEAITSYGNQITCVICDY